LRAVLVLLAAGFVCGSYSLSAAAADAQAAAEPDAAAQLDGAKQHFAAGLALFEKQQYAAARTEFRQAYALAPNERLHYNIGRCSAALDDPAEALRHYALYLRTPDVPADRKTELSAEIDRLRPLVSYISVRTNVDRDDVRIALDDNPPTELTVEPLIVNPGHHKVTLTKPGFQERSEPVDLEAAARRDVDIELLPIAAALPPVKVAPPPPRRPPWLVPAAGGGVVLLLLIGILGLTRRKRPVPADGPRELPAMKLLVPVDDSPISVPPKPENAVHIVLDTSSMSEARVDGSASATDIGRTKPSNQDRFHVSEADGLFVVADGIGGMEGGEVAAETAVTTIQERLKSGSSEVSKLAHLPLAAAELADAIIEANTAIRTRARASRGLSDMGTTCVAARFAAGDLHVAHIGDSRLYRLRQRRLEQLTTDHTMKALGMAGARGELLSRSLGSEPCPTLDVLSLRPRAKDIYLICSDGLSKMCTDAQITAILGADGTLAMRATALVDAANQNGGKDNITVVLFQFA
jgi:serine/threonine protein phosphatase PrpC